MQSSIRDILAKAAKPEPLSHESLSEHIYQGIVRARARYDDICRQVLEMQAGHPAGQCINLERYGANLKRKVTDFCAESKFGIIMRAALQMEKPALDVATRKIVENFIEEKILTRDMLLESATSLRAGSDISIPTTESAFMRKFLSDHFDEFRTIHYRMQAGPIFGLATSEEERAELDTHLIRFYRDAIRYGVAWRGLDNNDNKSNPEPGR